MKRKEKRKLRVENKVSEVIEAYRSTGTETDPMGQYTGNTAQAKEMIESAQPGGKIYMNAQNAAASIEKPVQDADDL